MASFTDIKLNVEIANLDEAMGKAEKLLDLLRQAKQLTLEIAEMSPLEVELVKKK